MVYKGRNRDTDWFAMTDADWRSLRPAYDAWLDPANFDADGRQRTRLSDLTAAALTGPLTACRWRTSVRGGAGSGAP